MLTKINNSGQGYIHSGARIYFGDKSAGYISKLNRNNIFGYINSVDNEGKLTSKKLSKYIKCDKKFDQIWLKSCFKIRTQKGGDKQGTVLTNDAILLTNHGYKKLSSINDDDLVATGEAKLTDIQYQILCGSLLGDGHSPKRYTSLMLSHCEAQKEWLAAKAKSFGYFDLTPYSQTQKNGEIKNAFRVEIFHNRELKVFRDKFYIPTRQAPIDILINMNWLGFAVWYLDNGRAEFKKTGGFSRMGISAYALNEESISIIEYLLKKNFGLSNFYFRKGQFHFRVKDALIIFDNICKFVPKCMQYKLRQDFRNKYDSSIYDFNEKQYTSWYPIDIYPYEAPGWSGKSNCAFGIEIENGDNLATLGGVIKSIN